MTRHVALQATFPVGFDVDAMWKTAEDRMPAFRQVPGLLQKVYMQDAETGQATGFYIFEDNDALDAYVASDLFASIRDAYRLNEPPEFRRLHVVGTLYVPGEGAVVADA